MHFVYILHSNSINKYYIGESFDVDRRLEKHNSKYYDNKWTARGIPWELFLLINCKSKRQAFLIEKHIKRMKSKKYIDNLKRYPEIVNKLQEKYSN